MKLTVSRLKKLIREELTRMTEQYEIDEDNMEEGDPREPYLTASDQLEPNYGEFKNLDFSNVDPMSLNPDKLAIGAFIACGGMPGKPCSLKKAIEALRKAGIPDGMEVLESVSGIVDMEAQKGYSGMRYDPESDFYFDESTDELYVPSQAI